MSWFVVNFEKENAVEVVPSKWFIQTSSECFWPPNNLSRWKIAEAIKSRLDPESNWLQHKSIKLGSYNDFKTADHKAKKAQKTNILSSGTEDHIVSQKRKVIKSRRYSSSSAKPSSSNSDSEGIVNPSSGTLSAVFQKDCSLETQEDKENTDELKDFERNVLRELSWINTKLNMIIDNLNSYNRLEKISNDDEPPTEVLSNLPVNNEEALFQLENYLNGSEANIILMAKELSKIGGTKVKDLLRRIMYRAISNEMGMLYSWDGAKGKKPLKQLALSRVIIRAVRFNRPTASASETEIVDLVRLWLVRCKDRANKQKKDNQEKTEN